MKFSPAEIPEVIVVEPDVWRDGRGSFVETWHAERYRAGGVPATFVQDNRSVSARGTLRGLHLQVRRPQGKLIHCVEGSIYDVAVDVRRGSPTFRRYVAVVLDGESARQVWVPPGFAHGFLVTSDSAIVEYKCTANYDPGGEMRIAWDDPDLGIPWPPLAPVLSEKDRTAPHLADVIHLLPGWGT